MFPLSNGRLIRLNKDGTNGEVFQTNKTNLVFGTNIFNDVHIKDVDPANEFACEISTDECGRVSIKNKSTNDIFVNDKALSRPSVRPLFNNNIIKICDDVEFRWLYKPAKENIGGDINDADFVSWSDPGKKNMKQSRVPRQKGRLTAHPINLYSSAHEDVADSDAHSTESNDERSTGCSIIPEELNDSVFTTQPVDAPNITSPLIDVSQALINFDETQINVPCDEVAEVPTVKDKLVETEVETDEDLMNFNGPSEQSTECGSSVVKSQPSNCSVITLSSDGSQENTTQENKNKNVDFDDEEMFERSISCPPTELPDDLFENCDDENTENLTPTSNAKDVDITDKANVTKKGQAIKEKDNEEEESKDVAHHSSLDVNSLISQQVKLTDTSIEQFCSNDDVVIPETQDIVIPETQEVLSQDSDVELISASCSIIDCEKSEYSFESKDIASETIKQNISIGRPNMSVVSISSDEGQELSRIASFNENNAVLDSENMFDTEAFDENQKNVEIKAEVPVTPAKSVDGTVHEQSTQIEQTIASDESMTMFSQSLGAIVDESMTNTDTDTQLLDNSMSKASQLESTNILRKSEKNDIKEMQQDTTTDTTTEKNDENTTVEKIQGEKKPIELLENVAVLMLTDNLVREMDNDTTFGMATETTDIGSTSSPLETRTDQHETDQIKTDDLTNISSTVSKIEEILAEENSSEPLESNDDEIVCVVPVATNSSISVCLSTDTTQELNLLAFNSELLLSPQSNENDTIDKIDDDTMDTLEFTSSESNDSGNVTASCANNTSSVNVSSEVNHTGGSLMKLTEDEPMPEIAQTFKFESNINQSENVEEESPPITDDIVAFSTPAKVLVKSDENGGSTVTRSSRRKQPFSNVEIASPKRTPRKLDINFASATPDVTDAEKLNVHLIEAVQFNVGCFASTPAKIESIDKTEQSDSAITRSTRRKQAVFDIAITTPKQTPRKLNSLAVDTPCETETRSSAESNQDQNVLEVEQIEENMRMVENEEPMHANEDDHLTSSEEVTVNAKVITDQNEDDNNHVNTETPEDIDNLPTGDGAIFSTPVQNTMQSEDSRALTIPRSRRRKPLIAEIGSATPKRTPRKLNVSSAVAHCKLETQSSVESNQFNNISEEEQIGENVQMTESVEKDEPTVENALPISSEEVIVNTEAITNQNENNSEISENIDDIVSSTDEATFATPVQNTIRSDEGRALTIPRSTRRKQLIAETGSVTPKRTPRKLNISYASNAPPCDAEKSIANEQNPSAIVVDGQAEENDLIAIQSGSNDEPIQGHDNTTVVFSTPVKLELATNDSCNSALTRSTRRKQNPAIESATPKQAPRKTNINSAVATPCKTEASEEPQAQGSIESESVENELISTEKETPSEEASEQIHIVQAQDDVTAATPIKSEPNHKFSDIGTSSVTRSTRRKPNSVVEPATPKQTPRTLNMSLAPETPCKSEETQVQENIEAQDNVFESTLSRVFATPVPKQTARKMNINSAVVTPCKIEASEEPQAQESIKSVQSELISTEGDKPSVEESKEIDLVQDKNDVTAATPIKSEPNHKFSEIGTSSVTRSTRRKPNSVVEIATPKQTPRKLNMSLASGTPCKSVESEVQENIQVQDNVFESTLSRVFATPASKQTPRKMNINSAVATPCKVEALKETQTQENIGSESVGNVPISAEEEKPSEQMDVVQAQDDVTAATPIKSESTHKFSEIGTSSVTRSTRRKPNPVEFATPKQTPRKLNMSLASGTPCKSEKAQVQENIEAQDNVFESTLSRVFVTPVPKQTTRTLDISHAAVTPCKMNINSAVATPCKVEALKETQTQEDIGSESVGSVPISAEEEKPSEQMDVVQAQDDVTAATLIKSESTHKFSEIGTSSVTRSTRRKPNPVIEFATPKQTPRKLNMSVASGTPCKSEETQVQENIDAQDNVFESTLSRVFATPVPKQTPRKMNINSAVATPCKVEALKEPQAQDNIESESVESEPISAEKETSSKEASEQIDVVQAQDDVTAATPIKSESTHKFNDIGTSSVTRSTRRKPNSVVEFATPKQTPKKLNMSLVPETPCQSEEAQVQENIEAQDNAFESTLSRVFATPASKQTTRTLDISRAVVTSCKIEASEEPQAQGSIESESVENTSILIEKETPSEEASERINIVQAQDDVTAATPIKCESTHKSDEIGTSSVTRSTRRKPNSVVEPATPKQTPRTLNMSFAPETPCKSEETQAQKNIESQDNVFESTLSRVFATPASKQTPREMNISSAVGTPYKTEASEEPQAQKIIESELTKNETISNVLDKNVEEVIASISSNENTSSDDANVQFTQIQNDVTIATPVKSEFANIGTTSASRSSRRKPNAAVEFATPKQTPRKMNKSLASQTPCKSEKPEEGKSHEDVKSQERSEMQDSIFESTLSRVFATPAKAELNNDGDSAMTRSSRRKQATIETATPKCVPSELNVSNILVTPCKPDAPSSIPEDSTNDKIVEGKQGTEEPVEMENSDLDSNLKITVSIELNKIEFAEIEPVQSQAEDMVVSTPAKPAVVSQLPEECNSSVTRSSKCNHLDMVAPITKHTPRKLNVSIAQATPHKTETIVHEEQANSESVPVQADEQNEALEPSQIQEDKTVLSTPEKVELNPIITSTATRSTRRKQPHLEVHTPKRTQSKINMSVISATPSKVEVQENEPAQKTDDVIPSGSEEKNIQEVTTNDGTNEIIQVEFPKSVAVASTPAKVDTMSENYNSSITRLTRRKKSIDSIVTAPEILLESHSVTEPTENANVNENQIQQDSSMNLSGSETDSIRIEIGENDDIATVSTPAKPEIKLGNEYNSALVRSSKRKRPDLDIETPVAKRTPKKLVQDIPLKSETKDEIPSSSKTTEAANVPEPEVQETVVEKSIVVENKTSSIEASKSAKIHDVVPAKINPAKRSTRNSKATRSTTRKANLDPKTQVQKSTDFNCVVKVTPLKAETLAAHKSTIAKEIAASVQLESQDKTVEKNSKKTKDKLDIVTPSTSETPSTPLKKRSTRTRTTSNTEPIIAQSKSKDAVDDLVAAVLEENLKETTTNSSSEESGKRAGTPLPASKNRTTKFAGKRSNLSFEANNKDQNDTDKSHSVDSNQKSDETESKNGNEGVVQKGKSSRRKKLEEVVPKEISKETKAAGTLLSKRNRNSAVESNEEAPSTSDSTKTVDKDETKKSEEKSEKAPVKATRRKRANTESDPVENTPKKLKTQLDHVNSAAVATPKSLRSLRNRVVSIDETNSTATPKRTRKPRKVQDKKVENVEPKDKDEEVEKIVEIEKPKRQPRRRLSQTASVDEPKESVTESKAEKKEVVVEAIQEVEETAEDKKPKSTTKRSRVKSKETVEDAKPNVDEAPIKPAARGTRKNSQAQTQAKPRIVVETITNPPEESIEQPVEQKTKRGRAKSATVAETIANPLEESVEQPVEPKTKRGRAKLTTVVETVANPPEESVEQPVEPKTKRGRTKSATVVETATNPPEESVEQSVEPKAKRGRAKKVVIVESNETDTSEAPEPAQKKRAARHRTVSKSEENLNKAAAEEPPKKETEEINVVSTKEPAKPRGKRTRKVDTEVAEEQSSPKRSRNTKKTKDVESEMESSVKEVVTEKKSRKTKKVIEPNDTDASTVTPPISTRTRRRN